MMIGKQQLWQLSLMEVIKPTKINEHSLDILLISFT